MQSTRQGQETMLSQADIEQYHDQGYGGADELLGPEELARQHAELERVSAGQTVARHDASRVEMEPDQPPDGTLVRRIYEPCSYYAPFRDLSDSDQPLDCVEKLLGPDLEFHYSKINMKPPCIGSV